MQASQSKIQNIIEGTKQYIVPLFQRPYSWGKKEWTILWEDLMELCSSQNARPHFLGSLVTMQVITVPDGVTKYTLIDGQQRLTTIFILLTMMRDFSKATGNEELANEINCTFLVNQFKKDNDYFKLMPTQADRTSFKSLIRISEITDSDQIIEAYKFFERKFKQANPDISRLKDIITNYLIVVSIVLDYDDNPHLVFEGLNAKGRPLTQADLIRNYLLMKIHTDSQDETYDNYWKPMQEALGDSITEFIRHYLMKDGDEIKQGDIYYCLKEKITPQNAIEYLKQLSKYSKYYERFLFTEKEPDKAIKQRLIKLQKIEMATAFPFLLNCYNDYSNCMLSKNELIEVLDTLINYSIRRYVCNVPTNQLNKIFPPLYTQIKKLGDINQWKSFDIQNRGNYLSEILLKVWPYFGDSQSEVANEITVTGSDPTELHILGQVFSVKSWRDVMQRAIETIAELEPDKFEILLSEFPRFVGRDTKRFRAIRQLVNGMFVEVNLSAKDIFRFCNQAFETIELTPEDWKVIY